MLVTSENQLYYTWCTLYMMHTIHDALMSKAQKTHQAFGRNSHFLKGNYPPSLLHEQLFLWCDSYKFLALFMHKDSKYLKQWIENCYTILAEVLLSSWGIEDNVHVHACMCTCKINAHILLIKLQFTFLAVIFKYKKTTVYNLNLCNRGVGRTYKMVHL